MVRRAYESLALSDSLYDDDERGESGLNTSYGRRHCVDCVRKELYS